MAVNVYLLLSDDRRLTVEATKHIKHFGWLFLLIAATGCRSFTEGDVVIRNGEAYIFTKALTREQIQDGNEIREMQNRVEKRADFIRRATYPYKP